jgi:hypothetical protein
MIRRFATKVLDLVSAHLPDRAAVNSSYYRTFGRLPDLKSPRTFNEKIAWRKLYQRDPRFTLFADKIAVKAEIERLVGARHVIETLWTGEKPEQIPFETLRAPYVVKASHSWDGNFFVRSGADVDRPRVLAGLGERLRTSHAEWSREWAYRGIPRRILVERMIETPGGEPPTDYKFCVYHGRAHFVTVHWGRDVRPTANFYDRDWNLLPVSLGVPNRPEPVAKPERWEEMLAVAEKIGAEFDFVRVDLYAPPGKVLFGETTFYPGAGNTLFDPPEWDLKLGEPWRVGPGSAV